MNTDSRAPRALLAKSVWVLVLASSATFLACSAASPGDTVEGAAARAPGGLAAVETSVKEPAQPVDVVYHAQVLDGTTPRVDATPLAATAYGFDPGSLRDKPVEADPGVVVRKIHPGLETAILAAERSGHTEATVDVVVTFKEEIQLPRFPDPVESESRGSAANVAAGARAQRLVADVKAARAPAHARRGSELAAQHGAAVLDQFWLVNGMHVRLPVGQVRALAARADVQHVEENEKGTTPPANHSSDARADMSTDPYFSIGATNAWIGLLDTGVRTSHTLLSHYSYLRDCVNGGSDCNTGSLDTDDDYWDHGTSSMSELTANGNLGDADRGVTGIYVDSFKVYGTGGLVTSAAINGFQSAIPALDRVILAQMQDTGDENSALAAAADAAYLAGAVVIAANGNFGSTAKTVRCPANARHVIGVGAADVGTLALQSYSGRGPTNDGRTKPDVVGPTNVYAASTESSTALQLFTGTSAAAANAAGAAALLRNLVRGSNFGVDPGEVNALIILAGSNPASSAAVDEDNGAGFIKAPPIGNTWWGKVTASPSGTSFPRPSVDVPIYLAPSASQSIRVALWWPDNIGTAHNDVDLHLINPSGVEVASSTSVGSVFEKTYAPAGGLPAGTWKVRITSWTVVNTMPVYYGVSEQ